MRTPLILLAIRLSNTPSNEYLLYALKHLLDQCVDAKAQDFSRRTALHYLCSVSSFTSSIYKVIKDLLVIETWLPWMSSILAQTTLSMRRRRKSNIARVDVPDSAKETVLHCFWQSMIRMRKDHQATTIAL